MHEWERQVVPGELNCGIVEIDQEKRQLIAAIDELQAMCKEVDLRNPRGEQSGVETPSHRPLDALLTDLMNLIFDHALEEEQLMKSVGYSKHQTHAYERHVEDHADIAERLASIIVELEESSSVARVRSLLSLTHRWANEHIRDHDIPFAEYFHTAGELRS